jgi:hypothetical protein
MLIGATHSATKAGNVLVSDLGARPSSLFLLLFNAYIYYKIRILEKALSATLQVIPVKASKL